MNATHLSGIGSSLKSKGNHFAPVCEDGGLGAGIGGQARNYPHSKWPPFRPSEG
jgi:hypothetical protein